MRHLYYTVFWLAVGLYFGIATLGGVGISRVIAFLCGALAGYQLMHYRKG